MDRLPKLIDEELLRRLYASTHAATDGMSERLASIFEQIREAFKHVEPHARRLGELGWTVPMWAQPGIIGGALQHTPEEIDQGMVDAYLKHRQRRLKELLEKLLVKECFGEWRPLLADAIWAFKRKKHTLVVPALLIVLEGTVARASGELTRSTRVVHVAEELTSELPSGIKRIVWASLSGFLGEVYRYQPFDGDKPARLNRHWILHGRLEPTWSDVESIRLLNALEGLSTVLEPPTSEAA